MNSRAPDPADESTEVERLREQVDVLRRQNADLNSQVMRVFQTERQFYDVQSELGAQLARIARLNDFALASSGIEDAAAIYALAVQVLMEALPLDGVVAVEFGVPDDGVGRTVDVVAARTPSGLPSPSLTGGVRISDCVLTEAGEPRVVASPTSAADCGADCGGFPCLAVLAESVCGGRADVLVSVPVHTSRGEMVALLLGRVEDVHAVSYHDRVPNDADLDFLALVGTHVSRALDAVRLRADLKQSAEALRRRTSDLSTSNVALQRSLDELAMQERRLAQSGKMEAIGRLAGGIAHDFNNALVVVLGCAELVREMSDLPDDAAVFVDQIVQAGVRAADLTRQLLAFGREQEFTPEQLDVNDVVANIAAMLTRLIGSDVCLSLALDATESTCLADRAQLERVLMNLAVNARDAMPGGGELTISSTSVELGDGEHADLAAGPYVRIDVRDTGCGMDRDTAARVFEPFFTTKGVGEGTGMGLAIVHGIVRRCGGDVTVETRPGSGTCFSVWLPSVVAEPAAAEVPAGPDDAEERVTLHGSILLVEDEEMVRKLATTVLAARGYQVVTAASGDDALAVAEERLADFDLLLTDVVMPGRSGLEVAAALRARRPDLPVLFMSGYSDAQIELDGGSSLLPKPFTPTVLVDRVRAALDEAAVPAVTLTPA